MAMTRTYNTVLLFSLMSLAAPGAPSWAKEKAKPKSKAPKAAKPVAVKAPLEELKLKEGDEKGNEVKSLKAELMVSKTEQAAIVQAEKLLAKYKGTDLEPEIQFRLAELYMRKSKTDRFFDLHRESETVVRLAPRLVRETSPRDSVRKAIEIYASMQKRFPDFPQMDLVIFNHAFANQTVGQERDAEALYLELIKKQGRSPLAPDAHLAVGELAFNRAQFAQALEHFNAIRKYPQSRVYPYGLYKAAWTLYNMHEAEKGLKKLEEVVAYGKAVAERRDDARLDLRKEALSDMVVFYEDVYPAKDAFNYFRTQAGADEVGPILLRMANLYERHSRFGDQRVVLKLFIAELPKSPLLAKVNVDLILALDHLREKEQAVAQMRELAKLCPVDSKWIRSQNLAAEPAKQAASECQASLDDTSVKLAKKWLKAWKKLPSDASYADGSEKAFEIYLSVDPKGEEASAARYAYADLLFSRQKYRQASAQYALVSQSAKPGAVLHDATYGAVVALEKAVGDKWSPADEKSFHELATAYVQKNPKGQYRLDIEYKMALLAYEKERLDEAAPLFLRLGREFPDKEKGQKAQDLYLDILNIKKDFKGVRNYAAELMKLNPDGPRQEKMRRLYETAYFLEIQGMEEKGMNKEALAEYQAFAKQNPQSPLTEKAVWNVMQLHYRLGDVWNGALTAEAFASQYPKSNQAENALMKSAQSFEQMGQLKEAARVLEKLAARASASPAATRWKELAADFYALDRQSASARPLYNELKSAGDSAYRAKILGKLEALERHYGSESSRHEVVQQMINQNIQPVAGQAKVEAVESLWAKGKTTEAFNEARHLLGAGLPRDLKARLRLVQAKVLDQEFQKQSVKARSERVGIVLAIKTEKLQKAQEAYQDAIRFGNPRVSLEAFERLYGCYNHYVTALKEMPAPTGLSEADGRAFRSEIDNLVVPLEEKSVDSLAQAVQFAKKNTFLDGSVARLERKLAAVNHSAAFDVSPSLEAPGLVLPVLAGVNP